MCRTMLRSVFLATIVAVPVGLVAWPVLALGGDDAGQAREIVKLIEQGQLALPQAVELAEKHSRGRAIGVSCNLQRAAAGDEKKPADEKKPGGPSQDAAMTSRVMYTINCFAKDKVQSITVDGLSKQVTDGKQPK